MRCNFVSRLSLLSLRSSLTLKKDSLSNNKKFVEFVIISFILTTVIIDPRVVMKGEISVGWWGLLTGSRCRSNCSGVKKKSCYFLAWGTQELRQELYGAKDGCLIL